MSKVIALKARPAPEASRRKRPSVTLFMHIRRTSLIARVPGKPAKAS